MIKFSPMQVVISEENETLIGKYREKSKAIIPSYAQSDTGIVNSLLRDTLSDAIKTLDAHLKISNKNGK